MKFYGFLAILVVVKIVYLYFESGYNFDMLEYSSRAIMQSDIDFLQDLEKRGHLISAVGITLLFSYGFYWLLRCCFKFDEKKGFILTLLVCFCFGAGVYKGLEKVMDYIIASNSDKRYQAYYTNLLKFGIAEGNFAYSSYIDNNTSELSKKVLLSNIYLLNYVDKEVIERVKNEGANKVIGWFIQNDGKNDFESGASKFNKTSKDIKSAWESYNDFKKQLNNANLKNRPSAEAKHKELMSSLDKKYNDYKNAYAKYDLELEKHMNNISNYERDLKRYFKYKEGKFAKRANNEYRKSMNKSFGKYIEPSAWCESSQCPTRYAIERTIKREAKARLPYNGELGANLSKSEFLNHPNVKRDVIKSLKNQGMNVGNDFDYTSLNAFKHEYSNNISMKNIKDEKIKEFQTNFAKKTGIKNISMDITDFKTFARLFENKIASEVKDKIVAKEIIENIEKKELNYKKIYTNKLKREKQDDIFLTQNDFANPKNQTAAKRGDDALKLLYIPPFAVAISIITGFINLLCVGLNILTILTCKNSRISSIFGSKILKVVACVAFIFVVKNIADRYDYISNSTALNKIDIINESNLVKNIIPLNLSALNSIIYLEEINYKIQEKEF